jgi:gliding motility-associated-like protein
VDVNNSGFTSYEWSPATGLDNPDSQNPHANLTVAETYTVTATTNNNCSATDDIHITVYKTADIIVPSGFTPNHDGLNDVLRPIPLLIREFHYFEVLNRWGQQVFISHDPSRGWDGTIGGQQQQTDTYIWMAEGIDFSGNLIKRKGTSVLIR